MTLNGEIRLQDAPFMVSAVMNTVYGREQGWRFVKMNWDLLDRRFPKQGLRRMCGGITGFCKPELERDVREFFQARQVDLGGKTLEQYLEQLRIGVSFAERSRRDLQEFLRRNQYSPEVAQTSVPG
jgi:puromycin-sensitive aminopeptidase